MINSIQIHFSKTIGNGHKITKLAENVKRNGRAATGKPPGVASEVQEAENR